MHWLTLTYRRSVSTTSKSQQLMGSSARLGSKTQSKTLCSKVFYSLLGYVAIRCHVAVVPDSSTCSQTAPAQLHRMMDTVLLSLWIHQAASIPSSVHGDSVAARYTYLQRELTADAALAGRSLSWLTQRCSPLSRSHREPSKKETRSRMSLIDTPAQQSSAPCRSRPRGQF